MAAPGPGRKARDVAEWVARIATLRSDARYELVDIDDFELPLLDEEVPPSMGRYSQPHTKAWAAKFAGFDGFVFVTPEYSHGTSAALKSTLISCLRSGTTRRPGLSATAAPAGRAVEHLRLVMGELMVADVRAQVMLSLHSDFEHYKTCRPADHHER